MIEEEEPQVLAILFHDDAQASQMAQDLVGQGIELLDAIALVQTRQAITAQRQISKTLDRIRSHMEQLATRR